VHIYYYISQIYDIKMALNKSSLFSRKYQKLSDYSSAMVHPAKISILERLAHYGVQTCGEITEVLPLAQSTVSQHLKSLTESGLVKMETRGLKSNYSLNHDSIEELRILVDELMNKLSNPM
jgi:DNA-binding transcriptional ArsR family regulator